jgi:hypothetical protein
MDNAQDDYVVVFLGDLGTDLPYREQQYWKPYNVPPAGPISETAFQRSFLGQFSDSQRVEHRFERSYASLTEAWRSQFGWPLYKPLHEDDAHVLRSMRIPTNTSFGQFDDQIVRLAKLVVDSLNEAQLSSATSASGKDEKGITKLERLLNELGIDAAVCPALRRVQGARTHSAAHRKRSDFELMVLLDGATDLQESFRELLEVLIERFDRLATDVSKLSRS